MKNEIFFPSFKMVFLKDQLWIGYKMSVGDNKKKKKQKQKQNSTPTVRLSKKITVLKGLVWCVIHAPLKSQTRTIKRTRPAGLPNWLYPLHFFTFS